MSDLSRLRVPVVLLSLGVLAALPATAQPRNLLFDRLSTAEGLSNFTPFTITQDGRGFLWVGTEHGLNRYDGHTFTVFRGGDRRDTSAFDGSAIAGLAVGPGGEVWVSTAGPAVYRHDPAADRFVRISLPREPAAGTPNPIVWNIAFDRRGMLWLGTNAGIRSYEPATERFRSYTSRPASGNNQGGDETITLAVDTAGIVWAGTPGGIVRLDPATGAADRFIPSPAEPEGSPANTVNAIAVDRGNRVVVGTSQGLLLFDHAGRKFDSFDPGLADGLSLRRVFIQSLRFDRHGTLWAGTFHHGLIRIPASGTGATRIRNDPSDPRSLSADRVTCIYDDASGVLWVGTYRNGLNRHDPEREAFLRTRTQGDAYAVLETKRGDLFVGTYGDGLVWYRKGVSTPLVLTSRTNPPLRLSTDLVFALREDKEGAVWIGTSGGLDRLDPAGAKIRRVPVLPPPGENHPGVKCLMLSRSGDLWFGTGGAGVGRLAAGTGTLTWYRHDPSEPGSLSLDNVWSLAEDRDGGVWAATFGQGLNRLDLSTGRWRRYRPDPLDTAAISIGGLYSVIEGADGMIWVGTFGAGLARLDPGTGRAVRYGHREGLPNEFVKAVVQDARGDIWFSTDNGLGRLTPASGRVRVFTTADGLHTNTFLSGGAHRGPSGMLHFSGEGGVSSFHPDSLLPGAFAPPVVLTGFTVLGRPLDGLGSVTVAPRIALEPEQNYFTFEFAALDFSRPDRVLYEYRLEGLDPGWVTSGVQRMASYTHVPPGSYRFLVRASTRDGVRSPNIAAIDVTVRPPFWRTWWFLVLSLSLAALLTTLIYRARVRRIVELERLRVRIASDLHDDVGSSLSRIALYSELVREGVAPEDRDRYLGGIADTSRELVTTMGDIVWSIDARNDTLGQMLEKMRGFASTTLGAADILVTFAVEGLDPSRPVPVGVRENLYLILKEALNNILKHAGATKVDVSLRNLQGGFVMTIADDGKGNTAAASATGHGMRNMRMRAERIGAELEIDVREGMKVTVRRKRL